MLTRQHSPKGIVSIVALGIFALLVVFGIIVANIVNQSYTNVKNTNEYLTAKALGDSALEFLEQKLQDFGPGYNSGEITCVFNGADEEVAGGPNEDGAQNEYCDEFAAMVGDEPVTITMEIKGRAEEEEKLSSDNCGDGVDNLEECYTVPRPGTGNAGENCDLYKPAYGNDRSPIVPSEIAGRDNVDQVDYACNWNKLALGSNMTTNVSIPLHIQIEENEELYHPFKQENGGATFYLRLRTPCNCEPNDQRCTQNICDMRDRYRLVPSDATLVDWQISGICNDLECGLVSSSSTPESVITSNSLNNAMGAIFNFVNLSSISSQGLDTSIHPPDPRKDIAVKLNSMEEPKFILSLVKAMADQNETSIPYLEYQIITNSPVSDPYISSSVIVKINEVSVRLNNIQKIRSELIDFAIQN